VVLRENASPFFAPIYGSQVASVSIGEQIPQASLIMPPIPGNVHGASLNRSELI
jgi:hypothetical protein